MTIIFMKLINGFGYQLIPGFLTLFLVGLGSFQAVRPAGAKTRSGRNCRIRY